MKRIIVWNGHAQLLFTFSDLGRPWVMSFSERLVVVVGHSTAYSAITSFEINHIALSPYVIGSCYFNIVFGICQSACNLYVHLILNVIFKQTGCKYIAVISVYFSAFVYHYSWLVVKITVSKRLTSKYSFGCSWYSYHRISWIICCWNILIGN